jgi:hypothetical protein
MDGLPGTRAELTDIERYVLRLYRDNKDDPVMTIKVQKDKRANLQQHLPKQNHSYQTTHSPVQRTYSYS